MDEPRLQAAIVPHRGGWVGHSRVLWGLLAVALVLRVYALGRDPLWYDEVAYAEICRNLTSAVLFCKGILVSPLFCAWLYLWQMLGSGDVWIRLYSVLFGVATVAVAWRMGFALANRRGAYLSALVVAASPFLVYYSRDVKMYAAVSFLELAIAYVTVVFASKDGKPVHLVVYAALAVALIYSHLVTPFYLACLNILYVILYARSMRKTLAWLAAQAVVVAASIPYLIAQRDYAQSMADKHFWAPPPLARSLYACVANLIVGYATIEWVRTAAVAGFLLLIVVAFLTWHGQRRNLVFLAGLACAQVAFVFLYSRHAKFPVFVDRYLIGSSAPLLIAGAAGLAALPGTWLRAAVVLAVLVLFGYSLRDLYTYRFSANPLDHIGVYRTFDAHGMRDLIRAQGKPGDTVWHPSWTTLLQLRWYTPEYPHVLVDMAGRVQARLDGEAPRSEQEIHRMHATEIEMAKQQTGSPGRVWLVLASNYPKATLPDTGFAAWLSARAVRTQQWRFGGRYAASTAYLFEFATDTPETAREHLVDSLLPAETDPAVEEAGPRPPEISVTLDYGPPVAGVVSPLRLCITNPGETSCNLAYEVTASDALCGAPSFGRSLQGRSVWALRPYADAQVSRMALHAAITPKSAADDTLTTAVALPLGTYDLFIERLTTGDRYQVPTAVLTVKVGDHTFDVPGEGISADGGWQWHPVGAFEQSSGQIIIAVSAHDPSRRPEAMATFSRLAFCRKTSGEVRQNIGQGRVQMGPSSAQTIVLKELPSEKRVDVTVANEVNSCNTWAYAKNY